MHCNERAQEEMPVHFRQVPKTRPPLRIVLNVRELHSNRRNYVDTERDENDTSLQYASFHTTSVCINLSEGKNNLKILPHLVRLRNLNIFTPKCEGIHRSYSRPECTISIDPTAIILPSFFPSLACVQLRPLRMPFLT